MKVIIVTLLVILASCSSHSNPRQNFEMRMERYIGRVIEFEGDLNKFGIVEQDDLPQGAKRLIIREGKCKYAMILNRDNVITEWSYVGTPQGCWSKRSWWEPF